MSNKRRTLRQLAVVNAWFDPIPEATEGRYSFHMDVAFQGERLGGGDGDPVRFRVKLKRCEVVVVLPRSEQGLVIDPRTIASSGPTMVTLSRETNTSSTLRGSVEASGSVAGASAKASAGASGERSTTTKASAMQTVRVLQSMQSRSAEGHPCWVITRADSQVGLEGTLWDPHSEPRFHILDRRPKPVRDQEERTGLHPTVTVEIRCKREDLEITDIALTDPEKNTRLPFGNGHKKRLKAAEAFIKHQLQLERLRVGDIHEIFSELVVGDMLVSLVDDVAVSQH